jgi:hypothetical protein
MSKFSNRSPTDCSLSPYELPHACLIAKVIVEMCSGKGDKMFNIRAYFRDPLIRSQLSVCYRLVLPMAGEE